MVEKDREFRLAMMGLLGFKELLERFSRLEERQQRLEEKMGDVLVELRELRRVVTVIAHRFDILTESSFREAMKYVVEEMVGAGIVER